MLKLTRNSLFIVTILGIALAMTGCSKGDDTAAPSDAGGGTKTMKAKTPETPKGGEAPVGKN